MKRAFIFLIGVALAAPMAADSAKPKKPHLDLRASPRMAFSPVVIHLTAEVVGGEDTEEFYCPEIEWTWDDGGRSVQEPDCPPFAEGTKIERRYSAEHEYPHSGVFQIKVTMRHGNTTLAANTVRVTVRPGAGDQAQEQ